MTRIFLKHPLMHFLSTLGLTFGLIQMPMHAIQTVTNTNDTGPGSLRQAIIDAVPGDIVDATAVSGTISLGSHLPLIDKNLTINGPINQSLNINGNNQFQAFFVQIGNVSISNLNIQNTESQGGNGGSIGGSGGGGALGAGGALFVNNGNVTINNVFFNQNSAIGGNGGSGISSVFAQSGSGGGGFLNGNGGTVFDDNSGGSGGGGFNGLGGNAIGLVIGQGCGGGGGGLDDAGGAGSGVGGDGGNFPIGGSGGALGVPTGTNGGNGGPTGGGGGGGEGVGNFITAQGGSGGNGGLFGGGGGGGAGTQTGAGSEAIGGLGGNGGDFGGGGGGGTAADIGAGNILIGGDGGDGGFGGGGGGGSNPRPFGFPGSVSGAGGNGGYGAGGGGGGTANFNSGAAAGGLGSSGGGNGGAGGSPIDPGGGGGGGAAYGGAIFVRQGGNLIINDPGNTFNNNNVTGGLGGAGGNPGGNGFAEGRDLYLMTGSSATVNVNGAIPLHLFIAGDTAPIAGSLTVGGPGILVLETQTAISYNGNITVNGGILRNIGQLASAITVNPGGTLGGTGIVGNVVNSGIVSPGNGIPIGTLTITNNYTQNANGIFEVNIAPSGLSDLLKIGVGASLAGTLSVIPEPGSYLKGTLFTILTANAGVLGTFNTVNVPAPLQLGVIYLPNAVQLLVLQNLVGQFIVNKNPGIVQRYLQDLTIIPGSDLANILAALNTLTSKEALFKALDQFHPALFGALSWSNATTMANIHQIFSRRAEAMCNCCQGCGCNENRSNLWLSGLGETTHQERITRLRGFETNSGGVFAGFDQQFCGPFGAGLSVGYNHVNLEWNQHIGRSKMNSFYTGFYTGYCTPCLTLDASILGGYHRYQSKRHIDFDDIHRRAHATHHANSISAHLGGQLNYCFCNFEVHPFVGVDYFYIHQNDFKEKGAKSLNLHVRENNAGFIRTEAGLAVSNAYCLCGGTFEPRLKLSWVYFKPVSGDSFKANLQGIHNTFTVFTTKHSVNHIAPGVSLTFWTGDNLSVTAGYEAEIGRRRQEHDIDLNIDWCF